MRLRVFAALTLLIVCLPATSTAAANRPIMGYDTYYSGWNGTTDIAEIRGRTNVYCAPSELQMFVMATNYLKDGLHDLGYNWMCISDGWQGGRDANGEIYANTDRFPNGMAHTIEVLHQLGFKVRLYTEVGAGKTCCGKEKSAGANGLNDARTYAKWKVDGVTVDTCHDFSSDLAKKALHEEFIGYLKAVDPAILYDVHVSPTDGQYAQGMVEWMSKVDSWQYTTEWGTLGDIWLDAVSHVDMAAETVAYMRPGHTPNLLIICGNLTLYQGNYGRFVFTFWSMFQSSLVVAEDYISYPGFDGAKFQTNRYCIAISQDGLFAPPVKMFTNGANSEVWVKPLASGATALAMLNRGNLPETISVDMQLLGVQPGATYTLTDGWNYTNLQSTAASPVFNSPANSAQLWILHPPVAPSLQVQASGGEVILSWPASVPDCGVQRLACLTEEWSEHETAPKQSGEFMRLTIPMSAGTQFYRLRR